MRQTFSERKKDGCTLHKMTKVAERETERERERTIIDV